MMHQNYFCSCFCCCGGGGSQPAQLLQMPLGEPIHEANNILPKPNPFADPDNTYKDSWLDCLWIDLFSSRTYAAVEAEARRIAKDPESPRLAYPLLLENRDSVGSEVSGDSACVGGESERGVIRTGMKRGSGRYKYEDYVELASMLQSGAPERQRQVVRGVLRSIFPSWFPAFYRTLFPFSKVRLGVVDWFRWRFQSVCKISLWAQDGRKRC